MTGSDYERKLARILDEKGYKVIRAPSSGSATTRDLPDLAFSTTDTKPIMIELKTTSQKAAYFTETEVNALERFATAFSGLSRLCARYKQDTRYYLYNPDDARRTPSNRYAVDRDIDPDMVIE